MSDAAKDKLESARRMDGGYYRLVLWILSASVLSILFYSRQIGVVWSMAVGFSGELGNTMVYPLAGLLILVLFLLLRWRDLHRVLLKEHGFASMLKVRVLGVFFALLPLAFSGYVLDSVALSAVSLVLLWYGLALFLNPSSFKMLSPYALLYVVATVAPTYVQSVFGGALADLASFLTSFFVKAMAVPGVWQGNEFTVFAFSGKISVAITADCSSLSSISVFLLLCGLMHLDLKKSRSSTLKLALLGVVALVFLNAFRIAILTWTGYMWGSNALWSIHNWLGYAVFMGFYSVALFLYVGMAGETPAPMKR